MTGKRTRYPDQRLRLRVRVQHTAPLTADLHAWMEAMLPRLPGRSGGRACLDNSAAERAIRPITLGRRTWTFAGSDASPITRHRVCTNSCPGLGASSPTSQPSQPDRFTASLAGRIPRRRCPALQLSGVVRDVRIKPAGLGLIAVGCGGLAEGAFGQTPAVERLRTLGTEKNG